MAPDQIISPAQQEQPVQEPVAEITGVDEYGPRLWWHTHWAKFPIGTKLYTAPQAQPVQEPIAWRWAYKGQPDSDKCFPMPVPDQDVQDVAKMRAFPRTVQLLYAAPQAQPAPVQDRWEARADELLTRFNDDSLPEVSGSLGGQRPAVKLTDEEIQELVVANAGYGNNFNRVARAVEQAVLRKNGVTE